MFLTPTDTTNSTSRLKAGSAVSHTFWQWVQSMGKGSQELKSSIQIGPQMYEKKGTVMAINTLFE